MSPSPNHVNGDDAGDLNAFIFFDRFPNEQTAIDYLEKERWPDGVICPHCNSDYTSPIKSRNRHSCNNCRKQFSVRTGAIFENSHIPLRKWIYAMYLFHTARKGISSAQISRELSISQKSAWFMMHRLREAMEPDFDLLKGEIEIDKAWIGGLEKNKHSDKKLHSNWPTGKQIVLGFRERDGRIIIRPIPSNVQEVLEADILFVVEEGAAIFTDEHNGYNNLSKWYEHEFINHGSGEYVRDNVTTNGIESVWAIVKRGHKGIYHQWSQKHGGRYLNEVAYRLTEGNMLIPIGFRVNHLARKSFEVQLTYKELTHE